MVRTFGSLPSSSWIQNKTPTFSYHTPSRIAYPCPPYAHISPQTQARDAWQAASRTGCHCFVPQTDTLSLALNHHDFSGRLDGHTSCVITCNTLCERQICLSHEGHDPALRVVRNPGFLLPPVIAYGQVVETRRFTLDILVDVSAAARTDWTSTLDIQCHIYTCH